MADFGPITLREGARRFEVVVEGHVAYVEFERFPGGIAYTHTIVPREIEGRGIGSALARHVLDYAAQQHLGVRPDCSFIGAYIAQHARYRRLVMEGTRKTG